LVAITTVLVLILSLAIMLLSCEVFTNGIEWLGLRLGLAETATGSVLAAVGTAMPETIVPLIAIFFGGAIKGEEVGVGAILGAPFMLATLAMFVGGVAVLWRHRKKKGPAHLKLRRDHAERDMRHFIVMYVLAFIAALLSVQSYFDAHPVNIGIAIVLLIAYGYYLNRTLRDEKVEKSNSCPALYLCRLFGGEAGSGRYGFWMIVLQVVAALIGIIIGARIFVDEVENVSTAVGIPTLILSLLIAPIATELPEKFNSVIWYLHAKDTLGFGNITGAMVFQSSIPVSIGLLFTTWHVDTLGFASMAIALLGSAWMLYSISRPKGITYGVMLASGSLYVVYIALVAIQLLFYP